MDSTEETGLGPQSLIRWKIYRVYPGLICRIQSHAGKEFSLKLCLSLCIRATRGPWVCSYLHPYSCPGIGASTAILAVLDAVLWSCFPLHRRTGSSPWSPSQIVSCRFLRCRIISRDRPRSAALPPIASGRRCRSRRAVQPRGSYWRCHKVSSRRWELTLRWEQAGRSQAMSRIAPRKRLSAPRTGSNSVADRHLKRKC